MLHAAHPVVTTTDIAPRVSVDTSPVVGAPTGVLAVPAAKSTASQPADVPFAWRRIDSPLRAHVGEVGSRFLYVAEQGAVLRCAGARVLVTKKDVQLLEVSALRLQGVVVYGNVQVSTQCLRNLLAENVWVSFFSRTGQYRGRVQPPAERGGRLRRRQWARSQDAGFCLAFAQAIVRGKIAAQRRVAGAYAKNRAAESLGTAHLSLRESLGRVEAVADLASLRGVEGTASRAYFNLFGRWNLSDLTFEGREKRGTSDPLNALLNLGYTMLTREWEGLIEGAGLDPTIGFYHSPDDDRPSLACDCVEEFRHTVVDRLVLTLVNKRTIKREDFEENPDRRGIRLSVDGLRKFLAAYERAMTRPPDEGDVPVTASSRGVMLTQLGRLLDAIAGRAPYVTHVESAVAPSHAPVEPSATEC